MRPLRRQVCRASSKAGNEPAPVQVEPDAVVVGVADQPQLLQRLDHLDAVRADLLTHAVVAERVRGADRVLPVAASRTVA